MSKIFLADPKSSDVKIGKLLETFERKVKVYPPGTCPLTVQLSLLQASKNQTCGKCVPCRDGLPQLEVLLKKILDGGASMETYEQMKKLAAMIRDTADCAIGYQAADEVLQGLETFEKEYISHIEKHECPEEMGQKVPCINLCPAHVDIPGYIALVGNEDYAGAINLIRKDNPLPTACAMICEHPCEERCRRNLIDDSLNIRGLKKYAVDQISADQVAVPKANVSTGKKVAVIGGG
ncbi:MAG: NADH-ubiquinone oxidoreductase-F iron-sulfur binding region domain-containing protein [Eubacterium sp.]